MDKEQLRLEIVKVVAATNSQFKSEEVISAAKNYEAYITSGIEDKVNSPSDIVKEQQKGTAAPSKKKPR